MAGETLLNAQHKWLDLLPRLGVDERFLRDKQGPCPICSPNEPNSTRFRFDNEDGRGSWFCNHCRAGNGLTLVQKVNGWDAYHAMRQIDMHLGDVKARVQPAVSKEKSAEWVRRIWGSSNNARAGLQYLERRGLVLRELPLSLRGNESLAYKHGDGTITQHCALVAAITNTSGDIVGVHRIYDADIADRKKMLTSGELKGVSVKLGPSGGTKPDTVIVCEGIETALAARELMFRSSQERIETEAALTADLLEQWEPLPQHKEVLIFADHDESYTGQAAAYRLAKRLKNRGLVAHVMIPPRQGWDWLDALLWFKEQKSFDLTTLDHVIRNELTNDPTLASLGQQFEMRALAFYQPHGWLGVFSRWKSP